MVTLFRFLTTITALLLLVTDYGSLGLLRSLLIFPLYMVLIVLFHSTAETIYIKKRATRVRSSDSSK